MGSKVKCERGARWVVTHYQGKPTKKRIGPTKRDERQAEEIAKKINAAITPGSLGRTSPEDNRALPCDRELRRWHTTYSAVMKPSYQRSPAGLIENQLGSFFGSKDLWGLREADLFGFAKVKLVSRI